jgi:hypothetical protein
MRDVDTPIMDRLPSLFAVPFVRRGKVEKSKRAAAIIV